MLDWDPNRDAELWTWILRSERMGVSASAPKDVPQTGLCASTSDLLPPIASDRIRRPHLIRRSSLSLVRGDGGWAESDTLTFASASAAAFVAMANDVKQTRLIAHYFRRFMIIMIKFVVHVDPRRHRGMLLPELPLFPSCTELIFHSALSGSFFPFSKGPQVFPLF